MAMFPDFELSDISNLFMPFPADTDPSTNTGLLTVVFVFEVVVGFYAAVL